MFKVIIAEDERIERESLIVLIKQYYGDLLQVVGEASNGKEALHLCKETNANMIMIDIQMPEMNGLEAAQQIKKLYPDIIIVIVTAYADFDYAKTAIKIGVVEYLVKPYSINTLKGVIDTCIKHIKKINYINESKYKLRKKMNILNNFLEKDFIIKIMRQDHIKQNLLDEYLELLNIQQEYFVCGIIKLEKYIEAGIEKNYKDLLGRINARIILTTIFDSIIFFAFENSLESFSDVLREIEYELNQVERLSNKQIDYEISLPENNFYLLNKVYSNIDLKVRIRKKEDDINPEFIKLEKNLCNSILIRDSIKAIEQTKEIINYMYLLYDKDLKLLIQYLQQLIGYIIRICNQYVLNTQISKNIAVDISTLYYCNSYEQVNEYMIQEIENIIIDLEAQNNNSKEELVRQAKLFVRNNYQNKINLNDVAEYIGVSDSYISRTFKKIELVNFQEYLTNIRIEKAQELLNTSLNVIEVANKVGYDDASYFSKVFKKYTGISPKDFKNNVRI